jgi:hypothetical protein
MLDLDSIKTQLDAMNHIYKTAFEEGRRSAFAEMLPALKRLENLSKGETMGDQIKIKASHTPTPWRLSTGDSHSIVREEGGLIVCVSAGSSSENDEALANAAFIVRAINAHYESLEVLKRIAEFLTAGGSLEEWTPYDDSIAFGKMVKHAIAKAEGDK